MSYQEPPPPGGPGGPGQPAYGASAPQGRPKKAVWALVLGILSLLCCGIIAGIPAIILGRQAQTEGGGGMARAGEILGYISIAVTLLWVILYATGVATFNFSTSTS